MTRARMQHGWQLALARPRTVLALFAISIAALAFGLTRLELSTDGRALLPERSRAVQLSRAIQRQFGVEDQLVLVVRVSTPGGSNAPGVARTGVLEPHALRVIDELSRELAALPGIGMERVQSLATEPGDHVRPGSLELRPWLDPLPVTEVETAALRRALDRATIYRGTLLSTDTPPSAAAIVLGVPEAQSHEELLTRVRSIAGRHSTPGLEVSVVGALVAQAELGAHLLADLRVLVPLALAIMALVLFVAFGASAAVWIPLAGVGAAQLAVFGAMGWCSQPVQLTTLLVPVLLTAVGVADAIHLFDRYRTELVARPDARRAAALATTLQELCAPILATALTTAAGFACFVFSPIAAVRAFGVWSTLGVVCLLVWTLMGVPAVLMLCDARPFRRAHSGRRARWIERCAVQHERLARFVARRWKAALCAIVVLCALAGLLAARTRVEDSWISGFDRASELVRTTHEVDRLFGGTHVVRLRVASALAPQRGRVARADIEGASVLVRDATGLDPASCAQAHLSLRAPGQSSALAPLEFVVSAAQVVPPDSRQAGGLHLCVRHVSLSHVTLAELLPAGVDEFEWELSAKDRMKQLESLGALRALEQFLESRAHDGVGAVLGPWSHLSTLQALLGASSENASRLLQTQPGAERALDLYARGRGTRRLAQLFSSGYEDALVTVLVRHASFQTVGRLLAALREWERVELAPRGLRLDFAGDLAESQALIEGVVGTEVISLISSLAGIFVLVALGLRSLALGLCAMLPCALAVLCVFAFLGASGVPLGVATSMFAAVSLGIGVDFAIHYLARLRAAREQGATRAEALARAARESGPAILIDGLAVGLGFGVLCCSRVPTSARLGWLLVISVAGCLVATWFVLPALLAPGDRRTQVDRTRADAPETSD